MAPSKWDEEEDSVSPPPVARRRFDDEEEEEVLDSWDAADDSETEREKAKKAEEALAKAKAAAAANKKTKAQRIEEHRDQRRREAEDSDEEGYEDETEAERRERLRRTEKDADMQHASDLFADIDMNRNRGAPKAVVITDSANPTNSIDLSSMPLFKPTTKDQFARLTDVLIPLLTPQSKKPHYALWAQDFARKLVKELPSADIKKIASALTTASNEKMREERAADKGNKKTKAAKTKVSLNANRDSQIDNTAYGDEDGLGDDDFM
ncbi:Eukaryotic translation initiation factor 3 subunit J [Penicillium ucsense]|uniref:Eukaryotic translation initiation factor 3 subunit J n=2 Tax=Penicillium TaxID=5073 RepID=A0A8J8WIW4_9EURO|nr:Eukaryotic translation initiation factor 3 subunit J [Penicillium diatomitis]KAF7715492.1 Eukaryotic translation initiation factor 3 subunit J [Penicillium ucsense]KAF7735232.1 Eukaryotic translation initiation factor 3 subunit J [Penicillium ucsense]KAJ5477204.1 Eukaryotic translation initiation factor 3 subunit J [Penicillium diatomitis]